MKTVHKLLYLILVLSLLSASCQLPFSRGSTNRTTDNKAEKVPANDPGGKSKTDKPAGDKTAVAGDTASAGSSAEDDGSKARIAKDGPPSREIKLPNLGKIEFSTDADHSSVATFPADGREVKMTVTDAAGLTWTLTLPGNALERQQNIRITALKDLKSSAVPGEIKSGLLLEPDGLAFYAPAVVTVSGAGLGDKLVLLTGSQDGSTINLALPGEEKSAGTALLYHFSTVVVSDAKSDEQIERFKQLTDEDEKAVIEEAKQLLKDKDIRVPEPPSIPLECTDKDQEQKNQKALDDFYKAVYGPEGDLISRLLTVQRQSELLSRESTKAMPMALRLLWRLEKKANLLIKTYADKPEKVLAVAMVSLSIAKDIQLLGGDTNLLAEIGQYCSRAVDQLIKEVAEQHNFKKIKAVWIVARWAALLGKENHSVQELQEKLDAALRFKFKGNLTVNFPKQEWKLQSEFTLRHSDPLNGQGDQWKGSGPGSYLSYTGASSVPFSGPGFTVTATITEFNACEGTAKFKVDRFFADSETYNTDNKEIQADLPLMKNAFVALFRSYQGDGGYSFPVKINNGSAQVINETVPGNAPGSQGKVTGGLEVQVEHSPVKR